MYKEVFKDKENENRRLNYCPHSQEIQGRPKNRRKNSSFSSRLLL